MKLPKLAITLVKRVLPILALILAILFVLFLLFFDSLAQKALKEATQGVPGSITVKKFSPGFSSVRLERLRWSLGSKEPVVEFADVKVDLRFSELMSGAWLESVREVTIKKPGVRIVVDPLGHLNLVNLIPSDPEVEPLDLTLLRTKISVEDGWVLYNDRRGAGFLYELSDWNGSFEFADGEYLKFDNLATPNRDGESELELLGRVALERAKLESELSLRNVSLDPFAGFPGFGPGLTSVGGRLVGSARATGEGESWNDVVADLFLVGKFELSNGSFQSPIMPQALKELQGEVELLGSGVSSSGIQGVLAGIPFTVQGQGGLGAEGRLKGQLRVERFGLDKLNALLTQELPVVGEADLTANFDGDLNDYLISGSVTGYNLEAEGQSVTQASSDFLKSGDTVYLSNMLAETSAGDLQGEGWLFMGDPLRVLFDIKGTDTSPEVLLPGLAQNADFQVKLIGDPLAPMIFGQGTLSGLGEWAQGMRQAQGRFVLSGDDLVLYNGLASSGSSSVELSVGALDMKNQRFTGVLAANSFRAEDLPMVEGLSGVFTGSAVVDADLSGETPLIEAQAVLSSGHFSSGGMTVEDASGELFFDGTRVVIPRGVGRYAGSDVEVSGTYDTRNSGVQLVAQSPNFDLSSLGMGLDRASVTGTVQGHLGGKMGVYGLAKNSQGKVALSAYQQANGQLGGVAWVAGEQDGVEVETTVVASGIPSRLDLEYNGQLSGPRLASLGGLELSGSAQLNNRQLTVRPTLLSAAPASGDAELYPLTTYTGTAYSFFGPLMSGPLKKVVIEESPFPTGRSMVVAGKTNLDSGLLDLGFQVRAAGLEQVKLPELTEKFPFQLRSGFGTFDGRVLGRLAAPKVVADFHFPWLMLSQESGERQTLGAQGRLELGRDILRVPEMAISQEPFDARLANPDASHRNEGMLNLQGHLSSDEGFDVRVKTAGFDPAFFAFFAPQTARPYIPSGRLATESLHLWGSLDDPSISGQVTLSHGGIMLGTEPYPLNAGFIDFSSQAGEIRLSSLGLRAPGIDLSGSATRRADGRLEGSLAIDDIELDKLDRFGGAFQGLAGTAHLNLQLGGRFPAAPTAEVGLWTENLTWNPGAVGGLSQIVPIEQFVLGHFDEDTSEMLAGLKLAPTQTGLSLELPPEGFQFTRSSEGLKVSASGAVDYSYPTSAWETIDDITAYLASPLGPDFGRLGKPFEMKVDGLSTSEAAKLTGAKRGEVELVTAFALSLEGQWWRDHELEAGDSLPHYRLDVAQLEIESGESGQRSGMQLDTAAAVDYQRQGEVGYLSLEDWQFGFFREEVVPVVEGQELSKEDQILRQGVVDAEGKLAITSLPGAQPKSEFNLGAADIPHANLAFLTSGGKALGGLIESLEVNLQGVLPSPKLSISGLATDMTLGPLQKLRLEGSIVAAPSDGVYRVTLGEKPEEAIALTFGKDDPESHQMKFDGQADISWIEDPSADEGRLELFAKNLTVSLDSPLDLSAVMVDKNLEILADAIPGEETTKGTYKGDLKVTGTLRRPEFEGEALLVDGQFHSRRYGKFDGLNLDARLSRIRREEAQDSDVLRASSSGLLTRLSLHKLEGTLGKQPFFGGGAAEFAGITPTFLKMFFVGESLPLSFPDLFTGRVDVDLELAGELLQEPAGPVLKPKLDGIVVIPSGDFKVPLSGSGGEAPSAEIAEAPGSLPLDVSIDLTLGKEFFVRALTSRIRAVGDLNLRTEDGQPKIYGQTQLSRGIINIPFYDAAFRVRQGVAIFDGPIIPRLESVQAVADVGGYRITARADGRYPETFKLRLFSDPPLPQAELNRIAVAGGLPSQFGGSSAQPDGTGTLGSLSNQGVSFLSGLLTNRLTEKLGNLLFLSELSFDYIPPATYAIKIAKSLDPSDSFLLTVTRIIRDNGLNENLFGVEWRFTRNLLVRVAFDQLSRARFWLQSINRF